MALLHRLAEPGRFDDNCRHCGEECISPSDRRFAGRKVHHTDGRVVHQDCADADFRHRMDTADADEIRAAEDAKRWSRLS